MLLFGADTWVLSEAMLKNIKGVHVGFLQKATGVEAQSLGDKNWKN